MSYRKIDGTFTLDEGEKTVCYIALINQKARLEGKISRQG